VRMSYRGVLLSSLLHATVYMCLHNLLKVLVQIASKMGLQKKLQHAQSQYVIDIIGRCLVVAPNDTPCLCSYRPQNDSQLTTTDCLRDC
jgi:hypothetical protein